MIDNVTNIGLPSRLDRMTRILLVITIAVCALYQLQHYLVFPFASLGRFALLATVGGLAIAAAPGRILALSPLFWVLGALLVMAGLHTYLLFGAAMGVAGTARFANVMVIAPLVALLFTDHQHVRLVLLVYVGVVFVALASHLYQFWGGSLDTLVGDYIAIRADLVRYMTVLGEPNVGGMIAVIGVVIGVFLPTKLRYSILVVSPSVIFVFMTISKAAALGLVVACIAIVVADLLFRRTKSLNRIVFGLLVGLALVFALHAGDYLSASIRSVLGQINGEPSLVDDLVDRQDGIFFAADGNYSALKLFNMVFGLSFGVAGSAAQEVLGYDAGVMLPHNSYMEIYITGGLATLAIVVLLMARAFLRLFRDARATGHVEDICALVCLLVLSCWMLVYPIIYEPATGALFWSLIGYGNRVSPSGRTSKDLP
ncbi:hypothetical protein [Devosia beringensis]|uniref:hypothetical protein n=1 Tax=Devosia beringensis TaxID=2657486 RepID=UPI00186B5BFE|nr:hypothetical protein [Devosia beringensis]